MYTYTYNTYFAVHLQELKLSETVKSVLPKPKSVIHGHTSPQVKLVFSFILTRIKPRITENVVMKWHYIIYNCIWNASTRNLLKLFKTRKPSDFSFFYLVWLPDSTRKNHAYQEALITLKQFKFIEKASN